MEIVIASTNLHKIREFREMLKSIKAIDVLSLLNFPSYQPLPEDLPTFKENAVRKAEYAAKTLGKWVLADDSGLVVPKLDGAPGVLSRRYAGDDATDAENRKKLLDGMSHLDEIHRSAYYECCLVLAAPDGMKKCASGICEGSVLKEARGRNGFGYDSLFVKGGYDKTFGELDESTKIRISHRHKAFEKIAPFLETLSP